MGIGSIGGGNQMLFGGSGGQDVFQKITWVLGSIFMIGSFILALLKSHQTLDFSYTAPQTYAHTVTQKAAPVEQPQAQE